MQSHPPLQGLLPRIRARGARWYDTGTTCEQTRKYSAIPGRSEHQTGDAVDFGVNATDFIAAAGTEERWLLANACRYGFVQSYPHGMSHVTGYIYEPWQP
jgi:LAS superfamily LD-carboxypeptidase LdcB